MATLSILVHKHWGCRIFEHLGSCLLTGIGQTLFGIVNNQFLAKGIDEVLRASADDELIGIGGGELHRVAQHITPETTRGRDHHRIVLALLHTPEGYYRGILLAKFIHRDELVEHTIVEHEQHGLVGRVILNAEEALTGIIGLLVVHIGRGDQSLVLFPVRREGHTPMEEHLDIGPHLFQMGLTCEVHHTSQHREHPGRYAREVGDILVHRLLGNALTLHLEVGQQGYLLAGHPNQIHQRIDVLDEDGTQVAYQRILQVVVGGMTASEDQTLAVEHPRLGIIPEIDSYGVAPSGIVDLMESFLTHRNEL